MGHIMINCKRCGALLDEGFNFCRQCGLPVLAEYQYQLAPPVNMPPKAAPMIERRDYIFVLLSFVIGFALSEFILFGGFGIAVVMFFAVFYAVAVIYLSRRHKVLSRLSALTFIPVFLTLLCFALYDNMALRALNVLALWIFTSLNLTAMAGLESRPIFWAGSWFDVLKVTFFMPFHHFPMSATVLSMTGKSGRRHNLLRVVITLLVISPVVIIVLGLLASSDAGFERLLNTITGYLTKQVWQYFTKIIFAVMLTFPVFSLLYSLRYDRRPEKHPLGGFMLRLGAFDTLITAAALTVFSLIYAVYIALQADYFFSALRGMLPDAFTYAQYARRGFFELVGVVLINFCLIAAALALTKRSGGRPTSGCRYSVLILAAMTLLLIVTAASKMAMYVGSYGLTPLRVYTSWFMLLLGLVTVFMMIKVVFPRFDFYRVAAVSAITLYLALNLANVDSIIAGYNISLYQQNYRSELDTSVFYQLSDSAIPQIAALKDDPKYGSRIEEILNDREKQIENTSWQNFSLAKYIAQQAIEQEK